MKRIYKFYRRDPISQVQQVNTISRVQIIDNLMQGKPVVDAGQFNESFDFPNGEVEFDKPRFNVSGDKIDRYLQTKQFDLELQQRLQQHQKEQYGKETTNTGTNSEHTTTEGEASEENK